MDMLLATFFRRALTAIAELWAHWRKGPTPDQKMVELDSWLEHKLEKLWEQEENRVLLHYEMLSQEGSQWK